MINHVRTLLQNMPPGWESDEWVQPTYVPAELPDVVQKIRRILWGRTPCCQVRIRQIMQMLHATELEEHVLADDPRVTYLPFDENHFGTVDADLAHFMPELLGQLTEEDEKELFGDVSCEPNKTYYNLWKHHDQLPYKLGGLLLAVAAVTERSSKCHLPQ